MHNLALLAGLFALLSQPAVKLQGRVFDAQSRKPLANVLIVIPGFPWRALTDADGFFNFAWLPEGEIELRLTAPGYEPAHRRFVLRAAPTALVEIILKPTSPPALGEVTVAAQPFTGAETNAASESTLNTKEIKNLASGLVADPVRAAQALPGMSGNDDLSSRFTLRGAGMRRVGFFVDGVLTGAPAHAIQEEQGGGSISLLNAETIGSIALLAGAFPAKYGDTTVGVLNFETREGNREQAHLKLNASFINSTAVAEGPWPARRGSWLLAVRRSQTPPARPGA